MRNNQIGPAEMTDQWCAVTGDDPKEVRQRAHKMRKAGLMPDFRLTGAKLTVEHISMFIIAMLASDQHILASQAALDRGALARSKVVSSIKPVSLWTMTGDLQSDIQSLLLTAKDRGPFVPVTLQVSQTHPFARMVVFGMNVGSQVAVNITYGLSANCTDGATIFPPRRITEIEGSVIWHMAELLTDG